MMINEKKIILVLVHSKFKIFHDLNFEGIKATIIGIELRLKISEDFYKIIKYTKKLSFFMT